MPILPVVHFPGFNLEKPGNKALEYCRAMVKLLQINVLFLDIHGLNGLAEAVTGRDPDIFLARKRGEYGGCADQDQRTCRRMILTLLALGLLGPQAVLGYKPLVIPLRAKRSPDL